MKVSLAALGDTAYCVDFHSLFRLQNQHVANLSERRHRVPSKALRLVFDRLHGFVDDEECVRQGAQTAIEFATMPSALSLFTVGRSSTIVVCGSFSVATHLLS
jgi:hypothetical protein